MFCWSLDEIGRAGADPILPGGDGEKHHAPDTGLASGQPIRSGLAQLDGAELKQAGLTIATAFDACKHVAGLSRLFDARSQAANARVPDRGRATATVIASFAVKAPSETPQTSGDNTLSAARAEPPAPETSATNTPTAKERPSWDVYRSGFGTSAFVYQR